MNKQAYIIMYLICTILAIYGAILFKSNNIQLTTTEQAGITMIIIFTVGFSYAATMMLFDNRPPKTTIITLQQPRKDPIQHIGNTR